MHFSEALFKMFFFLIYHVLYMRNKLILKHLLCNLKISGKDIRGISTVQLLSHVQLFATLWTSACQGSLSITNSGSILKLMPIKSVMPSNHLILCRPLLLLPPIPRSIRVFSMSQLFTSGSQTIGVSASTSVLPMYIQN